MTDTIEARVERGANLLDLYRPGWAAQIDLGHLDLSSGIQCVLGQLFSKEETIDLWKAFASAGEPDSSDATIRAAHDSELTFCSANYVVGQAIIGDFLRDKGSEEPRMRLMEGHGFIAALASKPEATHQQVGAEYKALDRAWATAVKDRQA